MVNWKYPTNPNIPIRIGWIIGSMMHQNSSARKVTHPSTLQDLSREFGPLYVPINDGALRPLVLLFCGLIFRLKPKLEVVSSD
jgi:hypothetical protein